MNDAFLVGVLHGLADGDEQFQPLARRDALLLAVFRERDPWTKSMTKYGRPDSVEPAASTRAILG